MQIKKKAGIASVLLLGCCTGVPCIAQQQIVNLSDLPLTYYTQDILAPTKNRSMNGDVLQIGGKTFNKGLSVHAPFTTSLFVGKKALRLRASVGVHGSMNKKTPANIDSITSTNGLKTYFFFFPGDNTRRLFGVGNSRDEIKKGLVEINVFGDDRKLWSSGKISRQDGIRLIDVALTGIEKIRIEVTDGDDGISGDLVDIAMPQIVTSDPKNIQYAGPGIQGTSRTFGDTLSASVAAVFASLPVAIPESAGEDWLLSRSSVKASVGRGIKGELVLSNGYISRSINLNKNAATLSLQNLSTGEEYVRAVMPEASITIDNQQFDIGGLKGQRNLSYLNKAWMPEMYTSVSDFKLNTIDIGNISSQLPWKNRRWIPKSQWPASGKELILGFVNPTKPGVIVRVHYLIYDGIPLIQKRISVKNTGNKEIVINHCEGEILAYPETGVPGYGVNAFSFPNFHIQNDYAFGGMSWEETKQSIQWLRDPKYVSQVDYDMRTYCIVKSAPEIGPGITLEKGEHWEGFNTYFLAQDGQDQERNSLSIRKMYRLLAPWSTENPIFMHLTSTNDTDVKTAIDQCAATGYEMLILSFGSGLNMEDTTATNLAKFKALAEYAHSKGVGLGGYSLFSSRKISPETDVIDIKTGKPGGANFGNAPCMGSAWGINYLEKLKQFFEHTGFDLLEHDGPYPGDFCASNAHPGHKGYEDSQWTQWRQSTDFYQWLLKRGIYTNVPDFYILGGTNKTGIGYREVNWSLPRELQLVIGRQNIYDGTYRRTPSMGWTFVPLVEYHGGGAAATLEPLSEHLSTYRAVMQQNYGSGVQAAYRGKRLYDTEATKRVVREEITHYKKYRDILNADIFHLRRPNGRSWDGMMHVDPSLKQKAYIILFNPTDAEISEEIQIPLYYTGLTGKAKISERERNSAIYTLNERGSVKIKIKIPPNANTWYIIEKP